MLRLLSLGCISLPAVEEISWPGEVAALWFGLIDLLRGVKKSSCSGECKFVGALVAGMQFFGVAASEKFAVVLWSTVVFANGVAVVGL